ncbi:MAG: hypothetical protein EXQ70_03260 [Solirubrobacterales bacterium]|nr:hypothetical protein [Solirubrobacterales bacterium]
MTELTTIPPALHPSPNFAKAFPERCEAVLADARDAVEVLNAHSNGGERMLGARKLRSVHEIYRLRVELEIESAAILWRTSEAVWALNDAIDALQATGASGVAEILASSLQDREYVSWPGPALSSAS